jgi:hypothetical protein
MEDREKRSELLGVIGGDSGHRPPTLLTMAMERMDRSRRWTLLELPFVLRTVGRLRSLAERLHQIPQDQCLSDLTR